MDQHTGHVIYSQRTAYNSYAFSSMNRKQGTLHKGRLASFEGIQAMAQQSKIIRQSVAPAVAFRASGMAVCAPPSQPLGTPVDPRAEMEGCLSAAGDAVLPVRPTVEGFGRFHRRDTTGVAGRGDAPICTCPSGGDAIVEQSPQDNWCIPFERSIAICHGSSRLSPSQPSNSGDSSASSSGKSSV